MITASAAVVIGVQSPSMHHKTAYPHEAAISTPLQPVARPWYRHLRFSMRTLILLVLAFGGGFGFVVHNARVQRDAVAAIAAMGIPRVYDAPDRWVKVEYDWELRQPLGDARLPSLPNRQAKSWVPKWLIDRVGVDYFHHVASVTFRCSESPVSDAMLKQIAKLSQLERLELSSSRVAADGLAALRRLSRLRQLRLAETHVTDAALSHLGGLTRLEELDLSHTQITDGGIAHLKDLTALKMLVLDFDPISDIGLSLLACLTLRI